MTGSVPETLLVISHRGVSGRAAENTHGAFEAALAAGVDGIETDLRRSADGQGILFHDRVAPDGSLVADLSRAELERLVGYAVPTLEEALERFPETTWMIEVKAAEAGEEFLRTVRRFGSARRIIVTSFDHPLALDLCAQARIEGGFVVAHRPFPDARHPFGIPARPGLARSIVWRYEIADPKVLLRTARSGYRNWIYELRTRADHEACRSLPIVGVVTDTPDLARPRSPEVTSGTGSRRRSGRAPSR